jgi:hypothetical protein
VADAAARPLHWVYDLNELNKQIKGREERPEFLPESKSPYYSLKTGDNSCYFDTANSVLKTLGIMKSIDEYNLRTCFFS